MSNQKGSKSRSGLNSIIATIRGFLSELGSMIVIAVDAFERTSREAYRLELIMANALADLVPFTIEKTLGLTQEEDIRERVQQASVHLTEAGKILSGLQGELTERNQELEKLLADIDSRRADAEHWAAIASVKEELASALTKEIERRVREQIRAELERAKTRRRIVGAVVWVVTLLLGGIIGAVIQEWWKPGRLFR